MRWLQATRHTSRRTEIRWLQATRHTSRRTEIRWLQATRHTSRLTEIRWLQATRHTSRLTEIPLATSRTECLRHHYNHFRFTCTRRNGIHNKKAYTRKTERKGCLKVGHNTLIDNRNICISKQLTVGFFFVFCCCLFVFISLDVIIITY